MNEEEFLRQLPVRPPSKMLDRRVTGILGSPRPRVMARRVALWQCVAACAVCAALAFAAGAFMPARAQNTPLSEVRWVVHVQPQPFNVFDWTQYPKTMAPDSVLQAANPGVDKTDI